MRWECHSHYQTQQMNVCSCQALLAAMVAQINIATLTFNICVWFRQDSELHICVTSPAGVEHIGMRLDHVHTLNRTTVAQRDMNQGTLLGRTVPRTICTLIHDWTASAIRSSLTSLA